MAKQQLLFEAAKATPPTLASTLARPRLLAALDSAPATARWLSAPSGSGKSTVAAQYARSKERALLWYRLDERDDDPAFFHAQFGRACEQQLHVDTAQLPHFAETDQHVDSDFAARFIGALSAALASSAPPALIVFDDTHKPRSLRLQRSLAEFALGAGPGIELLFVGEEPPPPALFDAIGARRLAVCADLDLRFDAAECAGIAQSLRLSQVDPHSLAALTGGHAGALVIACELLRAAPAPVRQAALASQLHACLLERLVARLTDAQRDLLLATCVLPRITIALATALSGRDVERDLEAAADRGLLIRHAIGSGVVYEMHGLVRAGLRGLAADAFGAGGLARAAARASDLLAAEGLFEDAFDTAVTFDLADAAGALLPALAERLARLQQPQSLTRALLRVPPSEVSRRPIVSLLAGHALLGIDEAQANAAFARAFEDYERLGDSTGMALAAGSRLLAFNLKCAELESVTTWLDRFHRHKSEAGAVRHAAPWHGVLQLAVLAEANQGEAEATTVQERAAALDELIALVVQPEAWLCADQQLAAATLTMNDASVQRSFALAYRVADMTRALADDPALSPLRRGRWWQTLGLLRCWDNDLASGADCLARLQQLVDDSAAAAPLRFESIELQVEIAMRTQALDRAEALVAQLSAVARLQIEIASAGLLAARVLLLRRRPVQALANLEASLAILRRAGVSRAFGRIYDIEQVYALIANERLVEAAALARSVADTLTDSQANYGLGLAACVGFLASGDRELPLLREGLERIRREDFPMVLWRVPDHVGRLCLAALEHDIETDFARQIIRAQKLLPPTAAGACWPWPVRVTTLGGFDLVLDGQPYRPPHKAQDRPLDLLKLLAVEDAAGSGRISRDQAAVLLWPDADTGHALKSLDMALARLRKLLGDDASVSLSNGRLALARDRVWVDLRSLHAALGALRQRAGPDLARRVMALYRGHLLAGDEDAAWLLGARRALWQSVKSAVLSACAEPACEAAVGELLERLLALDPTAEEPAQALMRWHQAHGQAAQAMRVYSDLRIALARALGVAPSTTTERVRAQLQTAGPDPAATHHDARLATDPTSKG